MTQKITILITLLMTALVTILVIYLTPLKNLDLISPSMKEVDPAAFWKEYNADPSKYVFYDVRPTSEYKANHAKGAISEPIEMLFPDHTKLPHSGKTIVLMCSGGYLSGVAYGYLEHQGFLNLLHVQGGLKNWIVEGLPIESVSTSTVST